MRSKIILLSTALVLAGWLFLSSTNQQISLNESKVNTPQISGNSPHPPETSATRVESEHTLLAIESNLSIEPNIVEHDYIVDCLSEQSIDDDMFDQYHASVQDFLNSLSDSNLKDKKLQYTLFGQPPEGKSKLDLLIEFNAEFPNTPLVLQEILRFCAKSTDKTKCDSNLIETAIASDRNNGAMWLQDVFFNVSSGNDEGIFYAIQQLDKSSFFDDGIVKKIKLFLGSLEDSPTDDVHLNTMLALGVEVQNFPAYATIIQWCKKNINDITKADSCLLLGNYMSKNSKHLLDQVIGLTINKFIFEAQGNSKLFEEADSEHKTVMNFISSEKSKKASVLMMNDERLLWSWLNNFEHYGENVASKLLIEDAINLSKNENYSPCKN